MGSGWKSRAGKKDENEARICLNASVSSRLSTLRLEGTNDYNKLMNASKRKQPDQYHFQMNLHQKGRAGSCCAHSM